MSQDEEKKDVIRKPDFGATFLPTTSGAPPPDLAPQALDHFKRGYSERASTRERDTSNLDHFRDRAGGYQKWQPPAGVKSDNHYQPRRNYNSYNNNYNKHDDKQYTRSCTYQHPLDNSCIPSFSLFIPAINFVGAYSFPFNSQPFVILYRQ